MRQFYLKIVLGKPYLLIGLIFLLSLWCFYQVFDFDKKAFIVKLDPSTESVIPADDPDKLYFDQVKASFDSGQSILVALVDEDIFTSRNLFILQTLSEELEGLDYVNRVSSLSLALNIRSDGEELSIDPFYEDIPETDEQLIELKQRALADKIYSGNLISSDGRVTVIAIHLMDVSEDKLIESDINGQVKALVNSTWKHGEVWFAGSAHINAEITHIMLYDLNTIIPLAMIVMALIALVSFRTIRGVLIPVISVGVSVLLTVTFMNAVYGELNQVTIVVPTLLIVIGFAYAIHVISSYYQVIREGEYWELDKSPVYLSLNKIAVPVIYTGLTTGIGFLSLATSDLQAIQQFGYSAGVGIAISMLVTLFLTPSLLEILPLPKLDKPKSIDQVEKSILGKCVDLDKFFEYLAEFDRRFWRVIIFTGACVVVACTVSIKNINISTDMIDSFKSSSKIYLDFHNYNAKLEGANSFYVVLETDAFEGFMQTTNVKLVESVQQWINQQPSVGGSTSIVDYLKVINKGIHGSDEYFQVPEKEGAIADLFMMGGNDELAQYIDYDYQKARIVIRTQAINSSELMQLVDATTQYLQENLPKHIQGKATGSSVLIAKTMDDIAIGQAISILTAFVIIYLVLTLLFTSFKAGFIALIPNVIPVLIYFGFLSWFGINLNVTTSLVACIVLGIAVDDTIHLMAHFNQSAKEAADENAGVLHALKSVGRPITYTTCALCLGFLCMTISEMQSQIEFGILAAATLLGAWVVDVTFTPAISSRMKIVSLWDVLSLNIGDKPEKSIPLFHGLNAAQARITALMAEMVEYKENEKIFAVGDEGDHMYVVIDGEIDVNLDSLEDGHHVHLKKLKRGDIIGEVALYHRGKRTANAKALSDVRLLAISRNDLEDIQKRHPRIAAKLYANLMSVFAGRMANLTTKIS